MTAPDTKQIARYLPPSLSLSQISSKRRKETRIGLACNKRATVGRTRTGRSGKSFEGDGIKTKVGGRERVNCAFVKRQRWSCSL